MPSWLEPVPGSRNQAIAGRWRDQSLSSDSSPAHGRLGLGPAEPLSICDGRRPVLVMPSWLRLEPVPGSRNQAIAVRSGWRAQSERGRTFRHQSRKNLNQAADGYDDMPSWLEPVPGSRNQAIAGRWRAKSLSSDSSPAWPVTVWSNRDDRRPVPVAGPAGPCQHVWSSGPGKASGPKTRAWQEYQDTISSERKCRRSGPPQICMD